MTTTYSAQMDWDRLGDTFLTAFQQTMLMVCVGLLAAGFVGLILGIILYTTREGGILANKPVYWIINVIVNFVRPIPTIILMTAIGPLTELIVDTRIGTKAAIVGIVIAATFGAARIVEQNLVTIDPGVIEAAKAMGASPFRIIWSVIIPEALGPLILGFTFMFIAIVDMSAMAGYIGGGGLGDFAIVYGYRAFNDQVTWFAVAVIIVIVQVAQLFGNWLAKKVMRR
ncbi:ABC transporter permease [Corynebacterium sp. 320]|uniref:ABC transporter permease n=1 Tax=Corynebacterium zhongnanshanii TaxID=2768834 RepID=A0ABQ6VEQ9_9CORY|nr:MULTISPECIES: methionine ABC transporter permease [Corynebacterium]KAB1504229.1 ABC transporter permease [Corynebacterium sp. 320]KAB1552671.1 ABC transporter permease [Corynebacterium sp. 321]KAB1554111.1 ABC transporter permease [Corynebacterium sp. 319]KAB3522915.1 ABC transporter permease [Corynebacterium zhongnanshanii]KAB3528365.1 ABC transporter permease [Corynebacterium sp. 250]